MESKIIQTPLIENDELEKIIQKHIERMNLLGFDRALGRDLNTGLAGESRKAPFCETTSPT